MKLFIIIFKYGIWSFEKFGGQTTKNIESVRKIALKALNVCLDVLCVFVFGETHVGGLKIIHNLNCVGNVWVQLIKGPAKGPTIETLPW